MPNFQRARESVRKLVKEKSAVDKLEVALQIADIIGGVVDAAENLGGLESFGFLTGSLALIKQITDSDDSSVLPNINFTYNGHDDGDSPMTAEYFRGRALKNIGGSAFSLIGDFYQAGTDPDLRQLRHRRSGVGAGRMVAARR